MSQRKPNFSAKLTNNSDAFLTSLGFFRLSSSFLYPSLTQHNGPS
ncbi:hypothetical protein P301_J10976 [Saccharomyces cerevisiae P301]|nr:hypothetical protein P301_J10976 [Saccharomyces cerevisiae P301]